VYLIAASLTVIITGSLSLFSEAGHMLADVWGIALSFYAINFTQKSVTPQRILTSLLNSLILVLLSIYIFYEGFIRIFEPPEILLILTSTIGIAVNFAGMRLLCASSIRALTIVINTSWKIYKI
jgi:cobalt-zinc-cadmium efflux system protein